MVYLSYILPKLVCFFFYLLSELTDLLSELICLIIYLFIKPLYLISQLTCLIVYLLVHVLEVFLSFSFKLFDVLASVGGVTSPINKTLVKISRGGEDITLPLEEVLSGSVLSINLKPGDIVNVIYQT